jgi:DNA repair exonuclease SbcCD ATPase subunit
VIVSSVSLHNWMPFRGRHDLELGPGAFAVVARLEADDERSNALGKTALLESIRFAVTGRHRHRTEDAWVTDGEPEGSVTLVLSDGTVVERSRRRGRSTQLLVTAGGMGPAAKGDEAQKLLASLLGLTDPSRSPAEFADEFEVAGYVAQGATGRLVTDDPAERTRVVSGWLQFGKLEDAEAAAAAAATKCADERDGHNRRHEAEREVLARELGGEGFEALSGRAAALRARLDEVARGLAQEGERARQEAEGDARWAYLRARAERYDALVARGRELAVEVGVGPEGLATLEREHAEALAGASARSGEATAALRLARGEFDGVCPVAGIACPAAAQIRGASEENGRRARAATVARDAAVSREREAREVLGRMREAVESSRARDAQLEAMRAEARDLKADAATYRALPERAPRGDGAAPLRAEHDRTLWELTQVEGRLERARRATEAMTDAAARAAEVERRMRPEAEAAQVLRAARRRVAEEALAEVEAGANERLAGAGVELEVKVRWEHEGKDPARQCGTCGSTFPPSAKIKECARCGAPRGRQVVQRLEFARSRQSGGVDDLAGVAIQMSASAWLRGTRGAAWATLVMDEPTAQLDAAHRRALARMVLGERAFEQLLVVSHHRGTLDSLPARIIVTGGPGGSRAAVVR